MKKADWHPSSSVGKTTVGRCDRLGSFRSMSAQTRGREWAPFVRSPDDPRPRVCETARPRAATILPEPRPPMHISLRSRLWDPRPAPHPGPWQRRLSCRCASRLHQARSKAEATLDLERPPFAVLLRLRTPYRTARLPSRSPRKTHWIAHIASARAQGERAPWPGRVVVKP